VLALIAILGLLILALSVLAGVSGVLSNMGATHALGTDFGVAGLHLSGLSVGQLFLYGIVVGAVAMLGLSMLLGTFSRRMASRGARRDLKGSQRETQALRLDRERLTEQLADQRREVDPGDAVDRVDDSDGVDRAEAAERAKSAGLLQRVAHRIQGRP